MSEKIRKGTVLSALMWASGEFRAAGIESFRLDAELLLSCVLGLSRVQLYINYDRPMNEDEKERFLSLVRRRQKREPVAYILNRREFMSLNFYVDRNVLIPRPETECMVEWIIGNGGIQGESRILDVGTGSGCIAVSLLRNTPANEIFASDIDEKALGVSERNFGLLCQDKRYMLIHSSLFENISAGEFDIIVSNPPYIKRNSLRSLMPEITEFEPRIALDGGENGDAIINRLIEGAYDNLRNGGLLIFEHGDDFVLNEELIKGRYDLLYRGKDYSGRDRFIVLRKNRQ